LMGVAVGVAVGSGLGVPVIASVAVGSRMAVLAAVAVGIGAGQFEHHSRTSSTQALSPALNSHITATRPATVFAGAVKVMVSGVQSDGPVNRGDCQIVVTGLVWA